MPIIQSAEPGAEHFIPYAKNKLREMHDYMLRSGMGAFAKRIDVSDGSRIFLNSVAAGFGVFVDRIRITAASAVTTIGFFGTQLPDVVFDADPNVRFDISTISAPTSSTMTATSEAETSIWTGTFSFVGGEFVWSDFPGYFTVDFNELILNGTGRVGTELLGTQIQSTSQYADFLVAATTTFLDPLKTGVLSDSWKTYLRSIAPEMLAPSGVITSEKPFDIIVFDFAGVPWAGPLFPSGMITHEVFPIVGYPSFTTVVGKASFTYDYNTDEFVFIEWRDVALPTTETPQPEIVDAPRPEIYLASNVLVQWNDLTWKSARACYGGKCGAV